MFTNSSKLRTSLLCGAVVVGTGLAAGLTLTPQLAVVTPPTTSSVASFTHPGRYTYTVPTGVTSLQTQVVGAGGSTGSDSGGSPAGSGTAVDGTLAVTPGQTITVLVGGTNGVGGWGTGGRGGAGDNGGYRGGNGGSASAIVVGSPQIVAGAGGGAGWFGGRGGGAGNAKSPT